MSRRLLLSVVLVVCVPFASWAQALKEGAIDRQPVRRAASPSRGQDTDASPFGIQIGMTMNELTAISGTPSPEQTIGMYRLPKVPRPHASFESYAVHYSDKYGVCRIIAIGKSVELNAFGDRLKQEFSTVSEQLQERYGSGELMDILRSGSIWDDTQHWSMAMSREERILARSWERPKNLNEFPSLSAILLRATAMNTRAGFLVLSFEGQNFRSCQNEEKTSQGSAF